ncbi:hypothetical protein [Lentzea flava]|uniref:Uncharacterized protein n=1 Tax=Lentzea flava TaxID=103732 RepID=A0ABQ2V251_9PSEU|nr:hypothetical protein [Lentzea flava]MCP2202399.1 hypothetical protein [Lentzea flava]GGU61171.1 hypothetical protein GCM10010178_61750 [Lentzea flava]
MLSHVEITARVAVTSGAHFVWSNRLEYSHDCFVCRRVGRTVALHHGATHGVCHSSRRQLEWQDDLDDFGVHPTPIRITGFDTGSDGEVEVLRCRLSFWWSPFADVKRPGEHGSELAVRPWVRVHYRVGCHTCRDSGRDDWFGEQKSFQSNTVWPVTGSCPHCRAELVTMSGPPEINLV